MDFLRPVSIPEEVNKVHEILSRVVRRSSEGDILLTKQAGWVAVPVESYSHITDLNQEQMQQTFLACGYRDLLAVALEPLLEFPSVLLVPATVEGIEEFNRQCGHFNFALFAGAPDWVIIRTLTEFDVVSGSVEFVSQLLNSEIESAFSRFQEFAENFPDSMISIKEYLLLIEKYLHDNYPHAEVGSSIPIIRLVN